MQEYETSQDKVALFAYAEELGLKLDSRLGVRRIKECINDHLNPGQKKEKKVRKLVKIMIHKTTESTGSSDVQVSVNGNVFLIKRGIEVEVPDYVVGVLKNAVKTEYAFVSENKDLESNDVLSYPFSVL